MTDTATRLMLLGAGELGKEVAIEATRLGIEVIAVDRYRNAPAMQVAQRSMVIDMLDGAALRKVVEQFRPDFIVPEIEAIDTKTLEALESEGFNVVPNARATRLTMDREGIRRLAAEQLDLTTAPFAFADSYDDMARAAQSLGLPVVVKPVMSSSGKGQRVVRSQDQLPAAWDAAASEGRTGKAGRVIVESLIEFDYEITLLAVRHNDGISFCKPIGHRQEDGDYRESWQPQPMEDELRARAQTMATELLDALGGRGVFGVEFFVRGNEVIFSEVSPRPHDTGMVTMISQNLSQFALHVRAITGLPIPRIRQRGPAASCAILGQGDSEGISFSSLDTALQRPDTEVRLFGKPEIHGRRRLGVALAQHDQLDQARENACAVAEAIAIQLD
jgi:phosphoribosylglycinamide formyltransferase 2